MIHISMETIDDENQRAGPIYRIDPTIGWSNLLQCSIGTLAIIIIEWHLGD